MPIRIFVYIIALSSLFSSAVLASEWQQLVINNRIFIQVEIVTQAKQQALGLGNRFSLPEGMGMLFLYNRAGEHIFWMKGMKFPIDIIWINRNAIVHIERGVSPPQPGTADRFLPLYGRGVKADMVLEVPDGFATEKSLTRGSSVQIKSE